MDGCEEADAVAQSVDDVLRTSQSAREQDGIDFSAEHGTFGHDVLRRVVDHGIDDEFGVFVTVHDALFDFAHVVATEVGGDTGLTGDALEQLLFGVFAREAQADEVGGGQTSGTLGRSFPMLSNMSFPVSITDYLTMV